MKARPAWGYLNSHPGTLLQAFINPMPNTKHFFTIILGAGASGLACGGVIARHCDVLIVDHGQKSACKVDIAGGGKANFSNMQMGPEHFYTSNPHFCISALSRFTPEDCLNWLKEHKTSFEERDHGQLFCSRSAKDFSRILRSSCEGCAISLNTSVISVIHSKDVFYVTTSRGSFTADNLVIALGSQAFPQAGATSLGIHLAKQFGHVCVPFRPALVGLTLPDWQPAQLAGVSLPVQLEVIVPDRHPYCTPHVPDVLPLLFTHTGISGPAVLQASLLWEHGFAIRCDFLPGYDLNAELQKKEYGKLLLSTVLKQFFPDRFAQWLLANLDLPAIRIAELSKKYRQTLASHVHSCTAIPAGTEGFAKAEVAKGGVDTRQVSSKTLESKLQKGLFFCGEVLDVTGRLGGYNLHWAIASGKTVGMALWERLTKEQKHNTARE